MNSRVLIILVSGGVILLLAIGGGIWWLRSRNTEPAVYEQAATSSQAEPAPAVEPSGPLDSDGDGIPDAEEATYKTDPHNYDTDGDGYSDGYEIANGMDPLKPNVYNNPNRPLPGQSQAPATKAPPTSALDSDHDGLTNEQEATLGTNPNNKDTDGDGLSDYDEVVKYKTNPLKADTDGDGFPDGQEVKSGYNPLGPGLCTRPTCIP